MNTLNHAATSLVVAIVAVSAVGASSLANADSSPAVPELYRKSYAREAKGDAAGALSVMEQIRAKEGASYFVQVRMAWLSYVAGRYGESARLYRKAAKMKPKAVEPLVGLTLPLLKARKWRELERACRDVLALDPNNLLARARLATALYSLRNYPDSATIYRKLHQEYPSNLDYQTGLGWALLRMGRRQQAKRLFQQVLHVSPDNVNAKAGLAAK